MITLLGEPRSTNNIYKYHCRFGRPAGYMSANGKNLKIDYQWQIKNQWKKKPLMGPITARFTLYFSRKGKHDIDNFSKLLLDALTGVVWEDDSQIEELHIKKDFDRSNPRIEIEINEKL